MFPEKQISKTADYADSSDENGRRLHAIREHPRYPRLECPNPAEARL